ncbi:MAG: redoxin domain-containing protein [bacterium]|nr:redoxin domain-containing protein [bacterium]
MKRVLIAVLLILILVPHLSADQKGDYDAVYRLFKAGKLSEALVKIDSMPEKYAGTSEMLQLKYNILMTQKKFDEALVFLEKEIAKSGESDELLSAKQNVLMVQGKMQKALKTALRKYEITKKKSPWDCMNIMHVYMSLENYGEALDWLQEAVSRGFISYKILNKKRYRALVKDKRFYEIIETIKVAVGLGHFAKKFSVETLKGEKKALSDFRGKVTALFFWATWCKPCKEDIEHLKAFYREFREKGFEIIAVSLDTNEELLKKYVEEHRMEFHNVYSGKGWRDKTALLFGVNNLPTIFIIDQRGVLRSFDVRGEELRKVIGILVTPKKPKK